MRCNMQDKQELIPKDQVFLEMDRKDDQQILASLNDHVSAEGAKQLFYSFGTRGKHGQKVEALSKQGVDECVLHMLTKNQVIREDSVTHEADPQSETHRLFTAKASLWFKYADGEGNAKETLLSTAIGTKRQEITNQWGKPVDFWYEFGTQKALRNAKSKLIPINVKQQIISMAKDKQQYQSFTQPQPKPQHTQQPVQQPKAQSVQQPVKKQGNVKFKPDPEKLKQIRKTVEDWIDTTFPWKLSGRNNRGALVTGLAVTWRNIPNEFALIQTKTGQQMQSLSYLHAIAEYEREKYPDAPYKAIVALEYFDRPKKAV